MAKVIAVQEAQLKMFNDNYEKNCPKTINSNNTTVSPIDMESQIVNLSSQNEVKPIVTNIDATNEVFAKEQNVNDFSFAVPYNEPAETKQEPLNTISDGDYLELLNSLRNMITDFANNAYSAIDKFQEEKLQGKNSGVDLINGEASNKEVVNDNETEKSFVDNSFSNTFDNQTVDLDQTIVLPADFIANNIVEPENEFKMVA